MQQGMVSSLFSFRSMPPDAVRMHDSDLAFIDHLCLTTHDLPTMQAAVRRAPKLAQIPISPVYRDDGNLGSYKSENGVEINMMKERGESAAHRFQVQLATLPHELRHGHQDLNGCLSAWEDPLLGHRIEDLIMCDRIAEADATAFSLTVMYELSLLKGDYEPLHVAREVHPGSVDAYWREIHRDDNAHWNGKAAQAAFCAYFRSDNRQRLQQYDIKLCTEFMRAVVEERQDDYPPPRASRSRRVADYMRPISTMPFVSRNGIVREREAYRPERCDRVMDHISFETKRYIDKANRILALD